MIRISGRIFSLSTLMNRIARSSVWAVSLLSLLRDFILVMIRPYLVQCSGNVTFLFKYNSIVSFDSVCLTQVYHFFYKHDIFGIYQFSLEILSLVIHISATNVMLLWHLLLKPDVQFISCCFPSAVQCEWTVTFTTLHTHSCVLFFFSCILRILNLF